MQHDAQMARTLQINGAVLGTRLCKQVMTPEERIHDLKLRNRLLEEALIKRQQRVEYLEAECRQLRSLLSQISGTVATVVPELNPEDKE